MFLNGLNLFPVLASPPKKGKGFQEGLLIALGLFLVLPVLSFGDVNQEVRVLSHEQGLDLTQMIWYFMNQEEYSNSRGISVPIRVPLRRPLILKEESGWLVCSIPVAPYHTAASKYYGTEVVIGHIEGPDKTYWNDQC